MPPRGYFVDANLLVLLVVGRSARRLIASHRRLQDYSVGDYRRLVELLAHVDQLFVTPNTLTEASNLLGQHGEPQRSFLLNTLRATIHETEEVVVASKDASSSDAFLRHGLTDAVLLQAISEETPLLTMDGGLYQEALGSGHDTAVNFEHVRALEH